MNGVRDIISRNMRTVIVSVVGKNERGDLKSPMPPLLSLSDGTFQLTLEHNLTVTE